MSFKKHQVLNGTINESPSPTSVCINSVLYDQKNNIAPLNLYTVRKY